MKRMASVLSAMLLFAMAGTTALAHEVPDLNRPGEITVQMMEEDGTKLDSGTLTFYRVGEIVSNNGDYNFDLTGVFTGFVGQPQDGSPRETAAQLLDYAEQRGASGTTVSIRHGVAQFHVAAGQLGVYLVAQHQATEGYKPIDPFLVTIPYSGETGYQYEVNATPKVGPLTHAEPVIPPVAPPATPPADAVLPQTGQAKVPVLVLAVLGLGMIGGGLLLRHSAKKDANEA